MHAAGERAKEGIFSRMVRTFRRPSAAIALAMAAAGCPPASVAGGIDAGQRALPTCTKAGDTCDFAPGKIGVCTEPVAGCQGGANCYVCTSLH